MKTLLYIKELNEKFFPGIHSNTLTHKFSDENNDAVHSMVLDLLKNKKIFDIKLNCGLYFYADQCYKWLRKSFKKLENDSQVIFYTNFISDSSNPIKYSSKTKYKDSYLKNYNFSNYKFEDLIKLNAESTAIFRWSLLKCPITGLSSDSFGERILLKIVCFNLKCDRQELFEKIFKETDYKIYCKCCSNISKNGNLYCDICSSLDSNKRKSYKISNIKSNLNYEYKVKNNFNLFINKECDICNNKFDNISSLAKHYYRKHKVKLNNSLIIDNVKCPYCDNFCEHTNKLHFKNQKYFDDLNEMFGENSMQLNLLMPTCSSCFRKSPVLNFKKSYSYLKNKNILHFFQNDIKKVKEDYTILYRSNISQKMMIFMRENNLGQLVPFYDDQIYTHSSYERKFIENFQSNFKKEEIIKFESNWDIELTIQYINSKGKSTFYVPDFYFEFFNGKKILFEIKSEWTIGNKDINNVSVSEDNKLKFIAAIDICGMNGVEYVLVYEGKEYKLTKGNYDEFIRFVERRDFKIAIYDREKNCSIECETNGT